MIIESIRGHVLWESAYALGIVALSVAVAFLVLWIFKGIIARLTARTKSTLDDHLFRILRPTVVAFVVLQGVFIALTAMTLLNAWQDTINKGWLVGVTILLFWTLRKAVSALIAWYAEEIAARTSSDFDDRALPILNRVAAFLILSMGFLVVLQELTIDISPLLAGLGIGGLAVALAVQPTLSNFLSGTYVLSDGSIRSGDYIEMQGGPAGTVEGVGWRATKLRTPQNNVVIVPNSKLSDSIVTNFTQPDPALTLFITCGVSYESDLDNVERVALEVMRDLKERLPQVDKTHQPLVLFREFGDSNITFFCVMRAADRAASFSVQHELVKGLYNRFREEGIEINYPVRKLVFPDGQGNPGAARMLPGHLSDSESRPT